MKKLTKVLLFVGLTFGVVTVTSITTAILITKNKSYNSNDNIVINKLSIIDNANPSLKITTDFIFNNSKTTLQNNNLSIYFDTITICFDGLTKPIVLELKNLTLFLSMTINNQNGSFRFQFLNSNMSSVTLNPNEQCVIVGLELSVPIKFDPLQPTQQIEISYKELTKK